MDDERIGVLVLEDEPMIALLYEDILYDSEFVVAGIQQCNSDALVALKEAPPVLAIVDFKLADGSCLPVVEALKARSIPFVVVSGHDETPDPALIGVPWLTKPFLSDKLLGVLRDLADKARPVSGQSATLAERPHRSDRSPAPGLPAGDNHG